MTVHRKKKKKSEILVSSVNIAGCTVGFVVVVFGFFNRMEDHSFSLFKHYVLHHLWLLFHDYTKVYAKNKYEGNE